MSEETRKVLEMLSSGKITVQEAEQLLQAVTVPPSDGKKAENVNIKVPMTVVRGGLRLSSVFPGLIGKKKIQLDNGTELDLSKIHYADLEAMIKDIGELTVDVDGDAQVRIRCE